MDNITAKPHLLKQANLSLIRKVIKRKGTVTRAEIVGETKISSTTVRSLLAEMMEKGEIQSVGYDESSGGRKAERYGFKPDQYYGAAVCIRGSLIHGVLVGICGEILEITDIEWTDDGYEQAVMAYLDELTARKNIKSIGIGVPGIVDGGVFWKGNGYKDGLCRNDLGDRLAMRYHIPVTLENDMNATAVGFDRSLKKRFPCESFENINMAYLYLEKSCISAGLVVGGRVVRGARNFAGELGLIPMEDGGSLSGGLAGAPDDGTYSNLLVQIICWICGILNPQYIVLGGPGLRTDCLGLIRDRCFSVLPRRMSAKIFCSADMWKDYHAGMAYITAGRIFDDIQFTKEQP